MSRDHWAFESVLHMCMVSLYLAQKMKTSPQGNHIPRAHQAMWALIARCLICSCVDAKLTCTHLKVVVETLYERHLRSVVESIAADTLCSILTRRCPCKARLATRLLRVWNFALRAKNTCNSTGLLQLNSLTPFSLIDSRQ